MAETTPTESAPASGAPDVEALYPSIAFPQTHPDKLAAVGRLFGLATPSPAGARVLELGCADGSNLLPMAQHAPGAKFVGIESSAKFVAAAKAAITAAGLQNVEVNQQEILEFQPRDAKFDFIIVHEVFSFVPDPVREKILEICRTCLSPEGVAYVSYNAFPGWGMRMALREMLLIHTRGFPDLKQRVGQARALMTFLSESVPTENNPYGMVLKQEVERMTQSMSSYLRHGILEEINQPFYFHQFIARAVGSELQYLGEPNVDQMLAAGYPPKVQEMLAKTGNNIILREQYMDFLRDRAQRHTLLVHRDAKLNRQLSPAKLRGFYFSSSVTRVDHAPVDYTPGIEQKFGIRGGSSNIGVKDPVPKAVFDTLAGAEIRRISVDELQGSVRQKLADLSPADSTQLEAEVMRELMQLCMRGVVDFFADRPMLVTEAPAKPMVTPLARYQAVSGRQLTNRVHTSIRLDAAGRFVLARCDGTNDRQALVDSLVHAARDGKLTAAENNQAITDDAKLREVMRRQVDAVLARSAALGFFVEQSGE